MVTTVACSSDQYHHSINTLKYADRAKEIKTHVVQNVGTVESHISDYQRIIDNLQVRAVCVGGTLMSAMGKPPDFSFCFSCIVLPDCLPDCFLPCLEVASDKYFIIGMAQGMALLPLLGQSLAYHLR